MRNISLSILAFALSLAGATVSAEQILRSEYQAIKLEKITDGLEHPWSIAFLPDGDMLVTERPGYLNRIDADGNKTRIAGTPEVHVQNQGGLMEVLPHPEFADNRFVYLTYSKSNGDGTATALARARLEGDALVDMEDIFVQDRFSAPGRHYGSKLAWMPDGTLLMSIGDRGVAPERAQDLGDHAGKLLRLTADGGVPEDNPFVGHDGALPEIFTSGNRNIQGLIVHPVTGQIWATEHGPRGGDELNLLEPGNNYGWPIVSRGLDYRSQERYGSEAVYTRDDMVEPVIDWTPSLAASGLAVVPDDSEFRMWRGDLLAGGLRSEQIRRVHFVDGIPWHQEELIRGEVGRIRDVRIGPDGNIYVVTDHANGALYRISPVNR
ncbi:MAG: PQQ-dependent sugar dehydrogenase [Wenzhouxiangella sp.]|nr:PQQ-dependent sugar dehydrogenase [Wenzhouxiangella sp.]MCH8477568.1 PQQ-dependent sugar dehydrogenase [Wenzhouxiangella sp.]TVR97286.1 MAG: PQQ-dependent sugar dehydrogenase [Wenzhouxiangellaceae bacterium]